MPLGKASGVSSEKKASPGVEPTHLDQARWQAVLDSAQDAIISIDGSGRITLFNRSAERIFGYTAGEMIGQPVNLLMPNPYRDEHDSYIHNYERTGQAKAIGSIRDVTAQRKDGTTFPIELSVSEARIGDDLAYMAVIRDVTQRREMESALRDSEKRSRAIVENAVDGIVVIDEMGVIESINPSALRMFGYSAAEVIGHNVSVLMPAPFSDEHDNYMQRYLHTGQKRIIGIGREVVGLRKDGTVFPLDLAVSEMQLSGRRVFTGMLADISKRREAEEYVQRLQKQALQRERLADVGAITAKIVHDLGNPLGGLSMHAQRIARHIKRDPAQPMATIAEPVERIISIIGRLDGLIRDFMSFAREQRLNLSSIDLPGFLAEIVDQWSPLAVGRQIFIRVEAVPDLVPITGDEVKLRRVFENLLKNALESIDAGPGEIVMRIETPRDGKIYVSVEDTGPGVAADVQLFKLFETTKADGSGFGLAIAKQVMLAHGGDIEFAHRSPHGAIFRMEFPYNLESADDLVGR